MILRCYPPEDGLRTFLPSYWTRYSRSRTHASTNTRGQEKPEQKARHCVSNNDRGKIRISQAVSYHARSSLRVQTCWCLRDVGPTCATFQDKPDPGKKHICMLATVCTRVCLSTGVYRLTPPRSTGNKGRCQDSVMMLFVNNVTLFMWRRVCRVCVYFLETLCLRKCLSGINCVPFANLHGGLW